MLSGVANGNVAAASTEAVNGGQLYSTNQNVTTAQNTANTANTTANTANTTANTALGKANLGIKVGNGTTNNQFALGETINVKGDDNLTSTTTADGVQVSLNKTLDLGATGSVTTGASKLSNTGITITKAATSPVGITDITLTNAGLNNGGNKIINVAAGTLSDTSTDAVNGSQLNATNTKVTTNTTNIATNTSNIAGLTNGTAGLVKQANGTAPITVGGTTAGTSVSFAGTAGSRVLSGVANGIAPTDAANVSQLKTSSVVAGNNTSVNGVTTGNNTEYTVNAAKSTVSAATDSGLAVQTGTTVNDVTDYAVELDAASKASLGKANSAVQTVTSGNSNLTASKTGNDVVIGFVDAPTFTGQVKANGFDANSQKIVNVANGVTTSGSKDAINGGQLNTTAGSIATNLGGSATYDATTGTVTAPTYTFANGTATPDTFNNVGDALGNLDTRTTTNTGNIAANAGNIIKSKTTVTAGKNVEVTADTNDDGSTNYIVRTQDDLVLTSVQIGESLLDTNGLTITGGPSVTKTGLNAGNKKITGVLAGESATDAVNKSQLDAITGNITAGGVQYDRNTDNTVNYDRVSFAGAPAVIGKDKNDNNIVVRGGTTLTNIANGINAADAVNKGQLDNVTKVKIFDKNGDEITVNIIDQVVNNNVNNEDLDSLFLTYDVEGQEVTDRLTIGETVQKMNTEGVKFSHTNGVAPPVGDALTNDSSAGGDNSTAIGVNAIITRNGESSIALGHNTRVEGASSVAIGNGSQANGNQSIAIGTGNIVNGDNSGAFGDPNIIDGSSSYSVGNNNNIDSDDTFVLGNNVIQTVAGSVVLGSESGTTTKGGIIGYLANINDINDLILATRSNRGAVAVGNAEAGIYRQITGVAAGTADSDAVNVSQLKAVNAKIDNIGGSNTTLNDAAVQYDKKDGNINKGNITLAGTSVSTGTGNNGNTVVTSGGTTITNVANGVNVSDAVNKGQLDSLGSGVAGIIGGGAKYENGKLVAGSNGIGNTGEATIHDAIASINNGNAQANESIKANTDSIKTNANNIKANNDSIKANTNRLNSGLSFGADSGNDINKSVGDSTAIKFEGGNNITTTATGNGIKFDLNGNISVDSVTTGNTTINNKGVVIKDGPSMTVDGIYAGEKTITGVADGIEVKDAVNFGQLNALDKRLGNSINELGYKIGEVEDGANAGISAAMAMSSLPQAYIPGKSMVGGGIATYNGQSAVAVGVSKVSDNGRWVIKANGTADTQGNAGGAIGAGFHF